MPESHNEPNRSDTTASGLLRLAQQVQRLKRVPRQGWLDRGVPALETESVADHSLGVALLAWMAALDAEAAGAALNPARVLALALVHDLPEAEIGDWTPYTAAAMEAHENTGSRADFLNEWQARSPERTAAKRAAERAVIDRLSSELGPVAGATLAGLWEELVDGQSPEARFVKQIDRLETFLQSRAYLVENPEYPMASFAAEVSAAITDPVLAAVCDRAVLPEDPR